MDDDLTRVILARTGYQPCADCYLKLSGHGHAQRSEQSNAKADFVKTFYVALVCEYPGDNFSADKDSKPVSLKRGCFNVCDLRRHKICCKLLLGRETVNE